jgi:hypothetical protein
MGLELTVPRQLPSNRKHKGRQKAQNQGKIGDKGGIRPQKAGAVKEILHTVA